MITIHKYKVAIGDYAAIQMPINARILGFSNQSGQAVVWAIVDTTVRTCWRKFRIAGTGHQLDEGEDQKYIGTDSFDGGLVWHCFDLGEDRR